MKRVCAWCQKSMGETEPLEDKSITHGMCPECYEDNVAKWKAKHGTVKESMMSFEDFLMECRK